MNSIPALYIHIPFCKKICTYCDFYKMIAKEERIEKYIHYLVQELKMKQGLFADLKTVYLGGGTPSALSLHLLDYLLYNLQEMIPLSQIEEFTIEANPGDVNEELVQTLVRYHINRVSLGVQSFDPEKLKILGRTHTKDDVKQAMSLLLRHGIENINVDLMYGIAGDTFESVRNDLETAIRYGAQHLSCYTLILEDKTILKKEASQGRFHELDDDEEARIYKKIIAFLRKKGFVHYEISNFSRKYHQCKHNLVYWDNMNYIGAGAGSSYYIGNTRYTNVRNLDRYCQGIEEKTPEYEEVILLSQEEQMKEQMILGLRKTDGILLSSFQERFQKDVFTVFPIIGKLINLGLLEIRGDSLLIPETKLFVSNEVLVNFI